MTTFVSAPYNFDLQLSGATGDAQFALCCQKIHEALIGCGMVDNNDTGSTDLATIARGTNSNVVRGTRMYRFNDSRQGVDPIFLKVEFTTGGNQNNMPSLWITVGQGSNGALTLTGQQSSRMRVANPNVNSTANYSAVNYYCHTEGYLGMFGRRGNYGGGFLTSSSKLYECVTISRTRDSSYNFDGRGVLITVDNQYSNVMFLNQFVRFASPASAGVLTGQGCLVPGAPASSVLLNGDRQLYPHFFYDPGFGIEQSWSTFTIVAADYTSSPATFTATPVPAGGPRTYIFLGSDYAQYGDAAGSASYKVASLWE